MKYIFFNLNLTTELNSNVHIKQHKLNKHNSIYKCDKPYENAGLAVYFNIIRNPFNNKIQMYYRNGMKNDNTMFCIHSQYPHYTGYCESYDGITFNKPNLNKHNYREYTDTNILLKEGVASTNFSVFHDKPNNCLKGIGGGGLDENGCKSRNNHQPECVKASKFLPIDCGIWTKPADSSDYNKCHINGLYYWDSRDGKEWKINTSKPPFLSCMHEGHYDRPKGNSIGMSPYDGIPSCFYDNYREKYFLYVRSNPLPNIRHIQYTTSTDFKVWDKLKFIKINPSFNNNYDNYYYSSFQQYPDSNIFIGFPSHFHKSRPYIMNTLLMFSLDGYNWIKSGILSNASGYSSVSGIIESNDKTEWYIYLQENYMNKVPKMKENNIIRHSIRRDGLTSICTNNEKDIGTIILKKINDICNNNNNMEINCKVHKNGYIIINIINKDNKIIKTSNKITSGDYLNKKIEWDEEGENKGSEDNNDNKIKLSLLNAEIFCLYNIEMLL